MDYKKLIIFIVALVALSYSVNAVCVGPTDFCLNIGAGNLTQGEIRTATLTIYNATGFDTTIVVAYTSNINISIANTINIAAGEFAVAGPFKMYTKVWNITALQGGDMQINATTSTVWNEPNISETRFIDGAITTIQSISNPALMYPTSNYAFLINVTIANSGTSADTNFEASLRYNITLLNVTNAYICSSGSCSAKAINSSVENGLNKTYITYDSSLAAGATSKVVFNITAANLGQVYTQQISAKVRNEYLAKSISIQQSPAYSMNITKVYNSTAGPLTITSSNVTVNLPIQVDNIGNMDLSSITVASYLNSTQLGSESISITASNYYTKTYSVNFETNNFRAGTYNLSVSASHAQASDTDSKLITISFTFNDSDSDGYYPTVNGGTDCNDADASKYTGASCTVSGYTGSSYNSSCICTGGTATGGGTGGGGGGGSSTEPVTQPSLIAESDEGSNVMIQKTLKEKESSGFAVKGKEHKITLNKIRQDSVDITLQSEPINATLYLKQRTSFDLDEDGAKDVAITLKSIDFAAKQATFVLEEIAASAVEKTTSALEIPAEGKITKKAKAKPETEQTDTGMSTKAKIELVLLIAGIIVIVIAAVIVWNKIKEKKRNRKKRKR
jgi:hypothetical protein